jgi:hypothetical protein
MRSASQDWEVYIKSPLQLPIDPVRSRIPLKLSHEKKY